MIFVKANRGDLDPFSGSTAPDQPGELGSQMTTAAHAVIVDYRDPVRPLVGRLPGRTLSAGSEIAIPYGFDLPKPLRQLFSMIRSGNRTVLLAPELQSEIDAAGDATVLPPKGMLAPYQMIPAGPWYESFTRTVGP